MYILVKYHIHFRKLIHCPSHLRTTLLLHPIENFPLDIFPMLDKRDLPSPPSSIIFAVPKSVIRMCMLSSSRMFSGFKSLKIHVQGLSEWEEPTRSHDLTQTLRQIPGETTTVPYLSQLSKRQSHKGAYS